MSSVRDTPVDARLRPALAKEVLSPLNDMAEGALRSEILPSSAEVVISQEFKTFAREEEIVNALNENLLGGLEEGNSPPLIPWTGDVRPNEVRVKSAPPQ